MRAKRHTLSLGNTVVGQGAFFGYNVVVGTVVSLTFEDGFQDSSTAPAWSANSTSYRVNSLVSYDGFVYRAIEAHVSAPSLPPTLQPSLWMVLDKLVVATSSFPRWFGNGIAYNVGDVVSYNGLLYRASQNTISSSLLTPAVLTAAWQLSPPTTAGAAGDACIPPSTSEPISHCRNGLGCNWSSDTCGACGGVGQPCCDGPSTPFGGVCVVNPVNPSAGCPVCNTGSCGANHVCQACGTIVNGPCCPPDESDVFASCRTPGVTCSFTDPGMTQGTCGACGGPNQPVCNDGTCEGGLLASDETCSAPNPSLELASLSITGPLNLEGTPNGPAGYSSCMWEPELATIDPIDLPFGDTYADCATEGPGNPFSSGPGVLTGPPTWSPGSGFTVTDPLAGPNTPPKVFVPSSSVVFSAKVAFNDDTTTFFPADAEANCQATVYPGVVEGNKGHYDVTVQHWVATTPDANGTVNGASPAETCSSSGVINGTACTTSAGFVPASAPGTCQNGSCLPAAACPAPLPSLDPEFPSVSFNGPSPTGYAGCWEKSGERRDRLVRP